MDTYYHPKDLARFAEMGEEAPELWRKFLEWYNAVFKEGALTEREKALVALGVAHAVQCPYCIEIHAKRAKKAGATKEELAETTLITAALRAGGAVTHGTHAVADDDAHSGVENRLAALFAAAPAGLATLILDTVGDSAGHAGGTVQSDELGQDGHPFPTKTCPHC